jgi:hypothetical protein
MAHLVGVYVTTSKFRVRSFGDSFFSPPSPPHRVRFDDRQDDDDDMPALSEAAPIEATPNGTVNGINGHNRPSTPTGCMSLTEYSANPSTPSEEKRAQLSKIVPEEYLLPNGFPDVSCSLSHFLLSL